MFMCLSPLTGLTRQHDIENPTVTGLVLQKTVTIMTSAEADSQKQYLPFV